MKRVPHRPGSKEPKDIRERSFDFAVRVVKLCEYLEQRAGTSRNLTRQLLKAGTPTGANLEEAQAAPSRPDFIHKNSTSLKEAREENYWLRLIISTQSLDERTSMGIDELVAESTELPNIIAKIIISAKE